MNKSTLHDDIAYMKSLAEAGGAGPLRNGATLFWAGLLYGSAAVGQYALIKGWLPQTGWMGAIIWFGASIVFGTIAFTTGMNQRQKQAGNATATTANLAWSGVGIGIIFTLATLAIVAFRVPGAGPIISYVIAPMILLLYGVGWWVSAKASRQNWLKLMALGCFLGGPAMGALAGMPEQLLAYAAALILLATVPGFILMRAEKA